MPHINPDLPVDDTTADVADYNIPLLAILAVLNGHLDADNIEPGSLPWSVMDSFSGEIPASAMEDSANVEKYRDELDIAFVANGCAWAATSGLDASMSSGVAYAPNGARYAVNAVTGRSFTASKDTYITLLSNGSLDYAEVSNNGTPPSLGSGALPLALVITNGSAVTAVHDMRPRNPDEVGRMTLGASGDRITVPNIPTWARKLIIDIILIPSGVIDTKGLRFNNDSGNNYSQNYSTDFVNGTAAGSQPQIDLEGGSGARVEMSTVEVINFATSVKMGRAWSVHNNASNAPADAPVSFQIGFKWANTTDLINRIDLINGGAGDFAIGSQIVVKAIR